MKTKIWLIAGTLFLSSGAAETILITNANVIDMNSEDIRRNHSVLIQADRITWLGPVGEHPDVERPSIIDAKGQYLIPGLIDAHVHLNDISEFPMYLSSGVTTVVELGGPDHRSWREGLNSGEIVGPSLITCGPTVAAESVEDARKVVAEHAKAGFDCIKIYDDISTEVFSEFTKTARELGLISAAHIPRNLGWNDMLNASPDAVAHAEEFLYSPCCSAEEFKRLLKTMREQKIALITTLTTYNNITEQIADLDLFLAEQPGQFYPPVNFRAWARPLNQYASIDADSLAKMRALFGFQQFLISQLNEAGASIVMGTDAGNTGTFPGTSASEELGWLVASGLSPYQALRSATAEAAAFIQKSDSLGKIAAGYTADLVLLAANPLDEISNVKFIRAVVSRGQMFDSTALQQLREQAMLSLAQEQQFIDRLDKQGLGRAIAWLEQQDQPLRLLALNELGYQKLKLEQSPEEALLIFQANVRMHESSWIAHASLAEALLAAGNRDAALESADRALKLAPDSSSANADLRALGLVRD